MTITDLKQGAFGVPWTYFLDICAVPRPSKQEEKIQAWLRDVAAKNSWECMQDATGNIIIAVPGCGALADASPLILQGHMDIVCEKNAGVEHDFMNDPIIPHVDGEWVTSGKTTLGADNGVALAYGLSLASETMKDRLPLELLFTTEEETGLTGALGLDAGMLKGRHVLNLDSEDEKEFIIGCAGGLDLTIDFALVDIDASGNPMTLSLSGLRGGHSGISIHENRDNAILLLGDILKALNEEGVLCSVAQINGGSKRNAIPREASAVIRVSDTDATAEIAREIVADYRTNEPGIVVDVIASSESAEHGLPLTIIDFLEGFPNGVIRMEPDIADLVRTSCSLGIATTTEGGFQLIGNTRSSSVAEKRGVADQVEALAAQCKGTCVSSGDYPGWEPHAGARIVSRATEIYKDVFGVPPIVCGIHAGLEAGIVGDCLDTRELLAFGPLIENAHSPQERLNISSFEKGYSFVRELVSSPLTD